MSVGVVKPGDAANRSLFAEGEDAIAGSVVSGGFTLQFAVVNGGTLLERLARLHLQRPLDDCSRTNGRRHVWRRRSHARSSSPLTPGRSGSIHAPKDRACGFVGGRFTEHQHPTPALLGASEFNAFCRWSWMCRSEHE